MQFTPVLEAAVGPRNYLPSSDFSELAALVQCYACSMGEEDIDGLKTAYADIVCWILRRQDLVTAGNTACLLSKQPSLCLCCGDLLG